MAFALFRVGFEFVAWLTDSVSAWLQDTLVNHFDWFISKEPVHKKYSFTHWTTLVVLFLFFIPFKKCFWFPARLPHFFFSIGLQITVIYGTCLSSIFTIGYVWVCLCPYTFLHRFALFNSSLTYSCVHFNPSVYLPRSCSKMLVFLLDTHHTSNFTPISRIKGCTSPLLAVMNTQD